MEGWIKLHRSFLDHWLCDEYRPLTKREAWETMLFTVNYEDKKVLVKNELIECNRGQSLLSLNSWGQKFNWSIQNVRSFFKLLESDKMIITEGLQYTTRLTICNYDIYQDGQQTANTPLTTTKEVKKEKKEKNNINSKIFVAPTIEEVKQYFKENEYLEIAACKFFNYYSTGEWKDSKGTPVKNWKQKAQSVWFKDENKQSEKRRVIC